MFKKLIITGTLIAIVFSIFLNRLYGQVADQPTARDLPAQATLDDLIQFALDHQARVQQALIDEEIGEREIASALSGWFPQLSAIGSYNRHFIIPKNALGDQVIEMGQPHTSALTLQAEQQILNPGLLQASKAARYIREQNTWNTQEAKINTVVEVSKAYYDILTTHEQVNIVRENIVRIEKQLDDAKARYESGIVDKTDFKRAQISLSNTRSDQRRLEEVLAYKYIFLKELIGLNSSDDIRLSFNIESMENEILMDTTARPIYSDRVEFQQLDARKQLQKINTQYQRWTFLPTFSASYQYALDFSHHQFAGLYGNHYPRSVFGLHLNLPIFQGTRRLQEIRRSRLMEERLDWDRIQLQHRIDSEYQLALATYRANLTDWKTTRDNVALSKEVYDIIQLQYQEGIRTYLDLMMAETELRTSQINYLNALFAVLSGKLDTYKALGRIHSTK